MTTYEAGQSFSELPGDRHTVTANASEKKPAKLLTVFVVDTNETELHSYSRCSPTVIPGWIPSAGPIGSARITKVLRS